MQKLVSISLTAITVLQLTSCAPAPHVRVGVKMNVPTVWQGTYPYAPPDSTLNMGRPTSDELTQKEN